MNIGEFLLSVLVGFFAALAIANIYIVHDCLAHGRIPVSVIATIECR